jgi:hypothetical protein
MTSALPVLSFAPDVGDVHVDLSTLITTRCIITGDSRSGKSRMVRQLLEQTYGRIPHLIIDPEGDFASLREAFDYLLVGRGGELAADVATAGVLAKRLFQLQANAIMDLSDLKPKPQAEYVAAFVAALMEIHQHEGHPTLVVVDECQRFAPEGAKGGASHDALHDLATRGGKRGFCLAAVVQRLSDFSKPVAGGLQNRLVFRTVLDVDLERAAKSLGFRTHAQREELAKLPRGHCFAYGPAIEDGAEVFRVQGVEATRTTHFDVTKGARPAPPPAPTKIKELVAELRDVAIAAQEERSELEQLRLRVKELEAKSVLREAVVDQDTIDAAVATAVRSERERQQRYRAVLQREAEQACAHLQAVIAGVEESWMPPDPAAGSLSVAVAGPDTRTSVPSLGGAGRTPSAPAPPPARKERRPAAPATGVKKGQRRILDALAWYNELGTAQPSRAQVAAAVQIAPGNPIFRTFFGALRNAGYLVETDAGVELTPRGRAAADPSTMPRSRAELHARWRVELPTMQAKMFDALVEAYPDRLSKAELAKRANTTRTNPIFRTWFGQLRNLGMFEEHGEDVQASPLLFPRGLAA